MGRWPFQRPVTGYMKLWKSVLMRRFSLASAPSTAPGLMTSRSPRCMVTVPRLFTQLFSRPMSCTSPRATKSTSDSRVRRICTTSEPGGDSSTAWATGLPLLSRMR